MTGCGINDGAIQKRLLAEPKLTYAKAVEIAQATETAAQRMRELQVKSENDTTTAQPTPAVTRLMRHCTGVDLPVTAAETRDIPSRSAR